MESSRYVTSYIIEGTLSDPAYRGNRDMVGWKLIGYPGTQRAYPDFAHNHDRLLYFVRKCLMADAEIVMLTSYTLTNIKLLLISRNSVHPNGLGNDRGQFPGRRFNLYMGIPPR